MTRAAPSTLGRARDLVAPLMHTMVERLDPHLRFVVSYHLGWCDEHGETVTGNGGKAVRPGLALLAAEAAGGPAHAALPGAVAVEMVHNFSLVHDDLMDRDMQRRHRKTVWALWGDATAVLAGDAMLSLAYEVLLDGDSPYAVAAEAVVARGVRDLIRGQALDTAFERRTDVGLAECLDMACGKTAALMSASAEIGAVLAGAPAPVTEALSRYGLHVGLAFQLVDDLLGIWGHPEVTGKPVYSDLLSHKKTLPVTWTIDNGGAAGRELADWLAASTTNGVSEDELRHVAALVERGGGRAWATEEARRRVDLACDAVTDSGAPEGPASELRALARYIIDREA